MLSEGLFGSSSNHIIPISRKRFRSDIPGVKPREVMITILKFPPREPAFPGVHLVG